MEKIKVAVIGCGNIANAAHIPAYKELSDRCEIKYFCDIIKERADKAVADNGFGIAIEDYHVALNDPEITAISVCTPNLMHKQISVDAMRAGKHVLCEKPAARTYEDALEMFKVQKETGMTLCIGVCTRFHKSVEGVRELVKSGAIGDVYHVFCSFRQYRSIPGLGGPFTTKSIAGGGCLIDWGVHRIDQILYMCGDPDPMAVTAATYGEIGKDLKGYKCKGMWSEATSDREHGTFDVDDSCSVFVRTTGPVITLEGAWAQQVNEPEDFVDIMGTKAGVRVRYCNNYTLYSIDGDEWVQDTPELPYANMYAGEIAEFFDAFQTGKEARHDIKYAIKTSRILQGAFDSSDAKKEIVF